MIISNQQKSFGLRNVSFMPVSPMSHKTARSRMYSEIIGQISVKEPLEIGTEVTASRRSDKTTARWGPGNETCNLASLSSSQQRGVTGFRVALRFFGNMSSWERRFHFTLDLRPLRIVGKRITNVHCGGGIAAVQRTCSRILVRSVHLGNYLQKLAKCSGENRTGTAVGN